MQCSHGDLLLPQIRMYLHVGSKRHRMASLFGYIGTSRVELALRYEEVPLAEGLGLGI